MQIRPILVAGASLILSIASEAQEVVKIWPGLAPGETTSSRGERHHTNPKIQR